MCTSCVKRAQDDLQRQKFLCVMCREVVLLLWQALIAVFRSRDALARRAGARKLVSSISFFVALLLTLGPSVHYPFGWMVVDLQGNVFAMHDNSIAPASY